MQWLLTARLGGGRSRQRGAARRHSSAGQRPFREYRSILGHAHLPALISMSGEARGGLGRRALLAALAVRLPIALAIRTAFAPDEYWQSIEVAHRLAFGYGHLTWEWAAGLRSYVHPLLFAAAYALLRALRLDSAWAVVRVPLLLQALAAAASDLSVARLAELLFGSEAAWWTLACQLCSWFNAYCLGRTYSNSLEATLTAAGTYHWAGCWLAAGAGIAVVGTGSGSNGSSRSKRASRGRQSKPAAAPFRRHQLSWLACAALCVVVRPSSALFWTLPAALALARQRGRARLLLLADAAALGGGLLGGAALVDRWLYGRWVVVPWEFLRFNLLAGASAQYGSHPWHWNLTQGLPTLLASLLPLLAFGLARARHGAAARLPALLAAWSVVTYSLPAHKEFRFLLPALQLLMPYCGLAAAHLLGRSRGPPAAKRSRRSSDRQGRPAWQRWGAAACLLLQLPLAVYFLLVHQGAQVGVMQAIRQHAAVNPPGSTSVLFLTPCHATPFYSHVHAPLPMRFLDCSPAQHAAATAALNRAAQEWLPLPAACPASVDGSQEGGEASQQGQRLSERQCFERDPEAFLAALFGAPGQQGGAPPLAPRPSLLVGYEPLMSRLEPLLSQCGYWLHRRLRNCWVQTDEDSPCELQLWARQAAM